MRRKLFVPSLLAVLLTATPFFGAVTKYETDTAHSNIGFRNSHRWAACRTCAASSLISKWRLFTTTKT